MDRHLDLVTAELHELVDGLVGVPPSQPFGLYALPSAHPAAELGRHVEREVFGKFFGNSPQLLAEEYGPYEAASFFFCVVDHRRRVPAGTTRVVLASDVGFKSLDDVGLVWGDQPRDVVQRAGMPFAPERTWDVATLAVADDYRGETTNGLVSLVLYQALATASLGCGIEYLVSILDLVVLDLIQTQTHEPFSFFPGVGPKRYLDSPLSVPVWCDLTRWSRRLAQLDPNLHEVLCQGRGLEAAVATPDWDQLVDVVDRVSPLGVPARIG